MSVAHLRMNNFWMRSPANIIGSRASWLEPNHGYAYCRAFFVLVALNEMPNRIETLRIRSGVRFMIRATSSNDFDALASSITRRSSANDQDLAIRRALL